MEKLTPTATRSVCAYKGYARYWSAQVHSHIEADVAWAYKEPHNYAFAVQGMVCFFNERVDVHLNGVRLVRPRSPRSY